MNDVTAAVLVKDGKIFIAKRNATDPLAHTWEFPGGKIDTGETPEACLKREMAEEFEMDVTVGEYLGESIYHYDHGAVRLLAYRTHWNGGPIYPREHADYRWVTRDQLDRFEFSPADIPFVERLKKGNIPL